MDSENTCKIVKYIIFSTKIAYMQNFKANFITYLIIVYDKLDKIYFIQSRSLGRSNQITKNSNKEAKTEIFIVLPGNIKIDSTKSFKTRL